MARTVGIGVAVLAAVTFIAAACGGDSSKQSQAMETATPPATSTATHDEALAQLRERASRSASATFTARYVIRVSLGDGPSVNGRITWYQANGRVRGDFDGQVGSQGLSAIVVPGPGYPEEELLYVCPYGEGGGHCRVWQPASEDEAYPPEVYPVVVASQFVGAEEFTEAMTVVRRDRTRTFLRESAACFTGTGDSATGTICATPDGITLSLELESDGQVISLTATELSRDVDDSALDLPFDLDETPP